MTAPYVAFSRFLIGLLLGGVLGLVYGFLRPLRRKKKTLPDLVFVLAAGWVYLYYGFAVCRGDLRLGYTAAPIAGAIGWDRTVGLWLRPVPEKFWEFIRKILHPLGRSFKKFWKWVKFLFASGKKWGTIK